MRHTRILLFILIGLALNGCSSERHVVTTPVPPAPAKN